jgi:hypothetical protein
MPLYDYYCKCGKTQRDVFHKMEDKVVVRCECGKKMVKDLGNCNKKDWFRPHWNEHIDHKPIYVESKEHYRKLCKERGLVARCLM